MNRIASVTMSAVLGVLFCAPGAWAQTSDQILNGLVQQTTPANAPAAAGAPSAGQADQGPAPQMKFFDATPEANDLIDSLLPTPQTKDLLVIPRNQSRPVGLAVTFDYDSDRITPTGAAFLDRLAVALINSRLAPYRFRLEGHTDAAGDAEYNLDLSHRRAIAVANYLVNYREIPASVLHIEWYGKSNLLVPDDPYARRNRAVVVAVAGRR